MASEKIQGITVQLKGDTKEFNSALKEVDANSRKLQGELSSVNKLLQFNPQSTELLAQKQQLLTESINNTSNRLDALRQAQAQVQAQFDSGEIGEEQYRRFNRELIATEGRLQNLQGQMQNFQAEQERLAKSTKDLERLFTATGTSIDEFADVLGDDLVKAIKDGRANASQLEDAFDRISRSAIGTDADLQEVRRTLGRLDDGADIRSIRNDLNNLAQSAEEAEESVEGLGGQLSNLAVAGAAGLGLAEIIEKSLDVSELNTKIDITFNVPESSTASVKDALGTVKSFGVEGEEALEGLRRQWALNKDASDETNASIVKGAAALTKAYAGLDFIEVIQEVNEIGKELKTTDKEAVNLVANLLNIGFPSEQLDIISEYGNQLQRAGFEAEQIKGIFAAGVATGTWNIDNLLDGLKEGRIKATEFAMGLSTSFKDAIKSSIGDVNKLSDEQIVAMDKGFAKQEDNLSKSLDRRLSTTQKSYDKQKEALSKVLDSEYKEAQKLYDKQYETKSKSLEKQYKVVASSYEKQKKELDKSLEAEMKAFEKASDTKISLIDKEFVERLKLIDEERYNKIKGIENEIKAIEQAQEAEDKRQEQLENNRKRAELKEAIRTAKDSKSKQDAQRALNDFENKLRLDKQKEQRRAQIDSLKSEKEAINETFSERKDALKEEQDESKNQAKAQIEIEKEALTERQQAEKEALSISISQKLEALKESNTTELNLFKEVNAQKLEALKEEQNTRKSLLSERLSAELDAVREANRAELNAFKEMNDQKLELAKNPPDSAAYQAIEEQLMSWGDAIAKGGKEGTEAFQEMTKWLDEMEEGSLKNAIGVEVFGTKWEDQGDNIVQTILGMDNALEQFNNGQITAEELAEKLGEGSGWAKVKKAVEDLITAMSPLLSIIADIIGKFAEWVSKNPELTGFILAIVSGLGILIGIIAVLSPIITAITGVMGLAGVSFGALVAPIGLVVAAIVGLIAIVAIIIANWKPITKFFSDLFSGLFKLLKSVVGGIVGFLSKAFDSSIGSIIKAFEKLPDKIRKVFEFIVKIIKAPINFIIKMINKLIEGLNVLQIPDWVPTIGGKGIDIKPIPMFAKGTEYFKGGKAIVGEQGAEMVELPSGSKVHNANKTADMLGGNSSVVITGNNFTIREESDIKKVAKELYIFQKQGDRGRGNR